MPKTTENTQDVHPANPWKFATILMAALVGAVLLVGVVTAYFAGPEQEVAENKAVETEHVRIVTVPQAAPAIARPTSSDIASCNDYAASGTNRTNEALKNGLFGGAIGAGVGAATGAIVKGGKGAGKGAGIGAIVGATAGTLYGLNKANQSNANAEYAYRTCMADRGF